MKYRIDDAVSNLIPIQLKFVLEESASMLIYPHTLYWKCATIFFEL